MAHQRKRALAKRRRGVRANRIIDCSTVVRLGHHGCDMGREGGRANNEISNAVRGRARNTEVDTTIMASSKEAH
jgi:hypothetical protein